MKPKILKLPNTLQVEVIYITGRLSLEITKTTTGKELFTLVCSCLGVKEFWYFGLQYERKGKGVSWLRPGKRVQDVVGRSGCPLYFLVKYYPEDVGKVADDSSVFFIYSQCKKEIVSGAVFCPPETSVLLASYALQAELGDWAHVDHTCLEPSSLIPRPVLSQYRLGPGGWAGSLRDWHRDHEGLTPPECHAEYLRVAQYLGTYGVSFFQARAGGKEVWVGVQPRGVNVYEDPGLLVTKTVLKWVFIKMVHYNCKKFVVRPVLETLPQYVFHMKKQRAAKQIFELAVGYHHLHVRNRLLTNISIRSDSLEKEKFKETTEEYHTNEVKQPTKVSKTTSAKGIKPVIKKHSCVYKKLPTLKEE